MTPIILVFLENAYISVNSKQKYLKHIVHKSDGPYINRSNATYSRIIKYLEEDNILYFAELTPCLANNRHDKFEPDENWIKAAIGLKKWDAIITCSSAATKQLNKMGIKTFANLPHPASFAWRKELIIDVKEKLNQKFNII